MGNHLQAPLIVKKYVSWGLRREERSGNGGKREEGRNLAPTSTFWS